MYRCYKKHGYPPNHKFKTKSPSSCFGNLGYHGGEQGLAVGNTGGSFVGNMVHANALTRYRMQGAIVSIPQTDVP